MAQLVAHGLRVGLLTGWEARIARRTPTPGARTFSVTHVASFALPEQRDDFGGGVTNLMRSSDVFMTLFEYGPEATTQKLFAAEGIPRVTAQMFSPNKLQRRIPGQLGCQVFFQTAGRAFCLYLVAGSRASLPRIVQQVNEALAQLEIEPEP